MMTMVPKPLPPDQIKPLPDSVGIYEGKGSAEESAYAETWQAQIDAFADACRDLGRAILKGLHLR